MIAPASAQGPFPEGCHRGSSDLSLFARPVRSAWSSPHAFRGSSPVYFLVSATHAARSVAFERSSMTDALDKALALLGSGLADVTVTHPNGLRHTTSEFLAAY